MKNKIFLGIDIFCALGTIIMFIDQNFEAAFGYLIFTIIFTFLSQHYIYELYKIHYSKEVRIAKKMKRISEIEKAKTNVLLKINNSISNDISSTKEKVKESINNKVTDTYKSDKDWLQNHGIKITATAISGTNPYKNAVPKEVYQFAYSDNKSKTYPNSYIVFDTETTGLEPEIDKIIEISAIKYINGEQIDYFSSLVNPKMKLDPFITKLTGIKDKDLITQPAIDKVLIDFFEFIEDYVLVAHNTPFDIKMIACEAYRNDIEMCSNKLIDTIPLAKRMIPSEAIKDYKLSTLKDFFGINIKSHRALQDCEMCNIVYQHYLKFNKIQNNHKKVIIVDENTGEVLQET